MDDYARYLEESKTPSGEFEELYGFGHDCKCAKQWAAYAEGDTSGVGLVSECWMQLSDDALEQCHKFKGKIAELERTGANLRNQVVELGGEPRV